MSRCGPVGGQRWVSPAVTPSSPAPARLPVWLIVAPRRAQQPKTVQNLPRTTSRTAAARPPASGSAPRSSTLSDTHEPAARRRCLPTILAELSDALLRLTPVGHLRSAKHFVLAPSGSAQPRHLFTDGGPLSETALLPPQVWTSTSGGWSSVDRSKLDAVVMRTDSRASCVSDPAFKNFASAR